MNHLIHMLVKEFLPDVEHRHKRQVLGMEGPNLAKECRRQILRRAPETPLENIKKIDDTHFEVQSSNSKSYYQTDLSTISCDCKDFPSISLCKHIATIIHFFGGPDLRPQSPGNRNGNGSDGSESGDHMSPGQQVGHSTRGTEDNDAAASVVSAANESMSLLQQLIAQAPRDPKIAKSLNNIQSWLSALVLSGTGAGKSSHFPEKEYIAPNQHSWPETATRMGENHGKKHPRGKVDSSLTAQHIGEPNRKRAANDNPYGAGKQFGKRAKPNARSAVANARAWTATALKSEPPPTPLPPASVLRVNFT